MRRTDREIITRKEIDSIIDSCDVCRLAFAVQNEPYLVPVSYGYDGEALYFHTAREGQKIDCIGANSRVCFEFERNVKLQTDVTKIYEVPIRSSTASMANVNDDALVWRIQLQVAF